jgi:hypothetical protein
MNLLDLINGQLMDQRSLKKLSQTVGAEPGQVEQLAKFGLPALMKALGQNASTPEGAAALDKALEQHEDDGVDNLDRYLNRVDMDEGTKILKHILSDKKDSVQQNLASQTGLKNDQVSILLAQLAPLVLGALGQQKKQQNLDATGVSNLLNSVLSESGNSNIMKIASQLLDADKDGDIMDDIGDLLGGLMKKRT